MRREHECGIAEAKRSIQKEVKAKLGELMAATAAAGYGGDEEQHESFVG